MTHRDGEYAKPSLKGRSHATEHHYVPERFFGRSKNRPGTKREAIFEECPWGLEGKTEVFCYECHEELIHNPVFLPEDIRNLAELVRLRQFSDWTFRDWRNNNIQPTEKPKKIVLKGVEPNPVLSDTPGWPELVFETRWDLQCRPAAFSSCVARKARS